MAGQQSQIDGRTRLTRAKELIPGGTSTLAKILWIGYVRQPRQALRYRRRGAFFTDNEGRKWLDCDMGLGAVMWGHCRPEIDGPVIAQVQKSLKFSVPPEIEMIAAELILQRLQRFDWLRFVKTGADAVSGAVRLARALTGRKYVVCGSYHGWHDWSAFHHYGSGGELGIPDAHGDWTLHLSKERWNNAAPYMRAEVAAFVVCPEHWPADGLSMLAKSCEKNGSLLIFDEVKSGLRFGPQGVWATRGIIPDLLCLSKGLANGYPLGALIGHAPSKTTANSVEWYLFHRLYEPGRRDRV